MDSICRSSAGKHPEKLGAVPRLSDFFRVAYDRIRLPPQGDHFRIRPVADDTDRTYRLLSDFAQKTHTESNLKEVTSGKYFVS